MLNESIGAPLSWLLVALLVLGCTSPDSDVSPGSEHSTTTVGQDLHREVLPSDVVHSFVEDGFYLTRQLTTPLIADCMDKSGFDFLYQQSTIGDSLAPSEQRYGLDDVGAASIRGYQPVPAREEHELASSGQSYSNQAAYLVALEGTSGEALNVSVQTSGGTLTHGVPAGCTGGAIAALYGSRQQYLDTLRAISRLEEFSNESLLSLQSSGMYRDTTAQWRECMEAGGETRFDTPQDAQAYDYANSEEERRVATIDVGCKVSVDMVPKFSQYELVWQESNLARVASDWELVDVAMATLLDRASVSS